MTVEPGSNLLHYRVVEKIGEGGMGVVWRAVDTALGRDVAIKILPETIAADDERRARFAQEARTLAALNHPNIAAIHGLHDDGDRVFLAMELVPGEDLAVRLARGPLAIEDAVDVARQIASALEAAHELGIVHRDLKPANVLRTPDGTIKVLDFGLAKILGTDGSAGSGDPSSSPTITSLGTQAGMILGTAAYMSPEQARGRAVDRRADVWALGAVIHEMLTGKRLFDGETISDTLAAVLRADVDFDALPADTPRSIRRIVRRCLERDPKRRLADAGEVRFAAEEFAARGADPDDLAGGAGPATPPLRSASRVWMALVPVALAVGAIAGAMLWPAAEPAPMEIVRATLPPPDGSRYFLTTRQPGPVAISPDGRRIAFVARGADRRVRLWVRALDEDDGRSIEGTEGASYPFWSPDARHVGFFADRMLKRVDTEGGAVLTLCDAPFGKGGSWNRDGRILFTPMYNTEIHVVDADGGPSTAVTRFDESIGENSHRFPWFLPDGEHFLYLARVTAIQGATSRVKIASLRGPEESILTETPAQAQFAAGHVLYVKDAALLARRFDPEAREFRGEPFAVADDVHIIDGAARGVFAASDDGKLVYMRGGRYGAQTLAWLGRDGSRVEVFEGPEARYDVAISPDGSRLAYTSGEDVWVYDLERRTRRRVTFNEGAARGPCWTPDGKTLIYRARGKRFLDLYAKAADGSGESRLLVETDTDKLANDVSPDGSTLVYEDNDPGRGFDIMIVALDPVGEPQPFLQTPFNEERAAFSPDGRFLAYQSDESGIDQVFVVSFPDQRIRVQVSTDGGLAPRWNDDGNELYFHSPRDELLAAPVRISDAGIEIGRAEVLFELDVPAYGNYDVSDDRFLVETDVEPGDRPPLHLLLHWPELGRPSS